MIVNSEYLFITENGVYVPDAGEAYDGATVDVDQGISFAETVFGAAQEDIPARSTVFINTFNDSVICSHNVRPEIAMKASEIINGNGGNQKSYAQAYQEAMQEGQTYKKNKFYALGYVPNDVKAGTKCMCYVLFKCDQSGDDLGYTLPECMARFAANTRYDDGSTGADHNWYIQFNTGSTTSGNRQYQNSSGQWVSEKAQAFPSNSISANVFSDYQVPNNGQYYGKDLSKPVGYQYTGEHASDGTARAKYIYYHLTTVSDKTGYDYWYREYPNWSMGSHSWMWGDSAYDHPGDGMIWFGWGWYLRADAPIYRFNKDDGSLTPCTAGPELGF